MSNALSIAAVTLTLRRLLSPAANANITMLPLDQARGSATNDQLNLFMYEAVLNGAWRNSPVPWQARPGESGQAPLPLGLHYLVTAYGEDESDAHLVFGRAMSILHDHPVLGDREIRDATTGDLQDSNLHQQPERLRITQLQLSIEEMSKLWSGFQTNYRLSAAIEVSVVLIDSTIAARAAPPVLTQGREDRGPHVRGSLSAVLSAVGYPPLQISAPLGALVSLEGRNLNRDAVVVRFVNLRLDTRIDLEPEPERSPERMQVQLPAGSPAIADWVCGLYAVSVISSVPDVAAWPSNEQAFALAPTITLTPSTGAAGDTVTLTCVPRIRERQQVLVFVGDHAVPATTDTPADAAQPTTVTFDLPEVEPGDYLVRLRVDGVDSINSRAAGDPPRLEFDPSQRVTIT